MGFRQGELGMEWFRTKDEVLKAGPGPVLVGASYEYTPRGEQGVKQARKYAGFGDHHAYSETVRACLRQETPHNLNEILQVASPRCLYFDLDGASSYGDWHSSIIIWLSNYVRWFFSGDRLEWDESAPEPVVLRSKDPSKYSCHVIFPQIQFASHAQQREYMTLLLGSLRALQVEMDDGETEPVLETVVDRVPYMPFQLFRGPYACKLKDGVLREETQFKPLNVFRGDELTCFAGHVNRRYALELAPPEQLLEWNEELRHYSQTNLERVAASGAAGGLGNYPVSHQDMACLYDMSFQRYGASYLDLAGRPNVEVYEECLKLLHPKRCMQFWSWFRITGVTYKMLEQYQHDAVCREQIWKAHCTWSSGYSDFCEQENWNWVQKSAGRRVSGLSLLIRLVCFDNPDMTARFSNHLPRRHLVRS